MLKFKDLILVFILSSAAATIEPIIEVASPTKPEHVSFNNGELIVVSKNATSIRLTCKASYPVMWSLDSLEQPWASSTGSGRNVLDFRNTSTYSYSMTVELNNLHNDNTIINMGPEEYTCHAAARPSTETRVLIVWEGLEWPYWNQNELDKHPRVNSSYQLFWTEPFLIEFKFKFKLIIPCYTLNTNEVSVELYRRESSAALKFLASESGSVTSGVRFENYVGFVVTLSAIPSKHEVYWCHAKPKVSGTLSDKNSSISFTVIQQVRGRVRFGPGLPGPAVRADLAATTVEELFARFEHQETAHIVMTHTEDMVMCCIKPNGNTGTLVHANLVLYSKPCHGPVFCLTKTHTISSRPIEEGKVFNRTCRYLQTVHPFAKFLGPFPSLYTCHVRTDAPISMFERSRLNRNQDFRGNTTESAYFLAPDSTHAPSMVKMFYGDPSRKPNGRGGLELSNGASQTFAAGHVTRFRCQGPDFYFANGVVWELEWKNGTEFATGQLGDNSLNVTTTHELVKVSCHIPLWNSTAWVTRSVFVNVQMPRAPVTADGHTFIEEEVEFYVEESKILSCDFNGLPQPSYTWNISSPGLVYSFLENGQRLQRTWLPYDEPTSSNLTVHLFSIKYLRNSALPIPKQTFTCTAENSLGNATKVFRVQAIRAVAPQIINSTTGRQTLFLDEENQFLNCTVQSGARPEPAFLWERNGTNISSSSDQQYEIHTNGTSSLLLFKVAVTQVDEGQYKCTASNSAGSSAAVYRVKVEPGASKLGWIKIVFTAIAALIICSALVFVYCRKWKRTEGACGASGMRAQYLNLHGQQEESMVTVATLDE